MFVKEHLLKAVRDAAIYNPDVQVAPTCILWPDQDRQWEAVVPRLQAELPELLILGDYAPEKRIGPAIWLRCLLAGKVDGITCLSRLTPIIYLPGVSRQDLRAVENCPDHLKPLAELQYRGVIWSQINSKDWTILAYLKSDQGGLGLDVAQDNESKNAMQISLHRLLDEDVDLLYGKRLDKDYFNTLLTGGDPVRDVLLWLDQGDGFKTGRGENEWKAFAEVCKSQFAFDPGKEGPIACAEKLASRKGPWKAIWQRFCEAPKRYPNIPAQIRKCPVPGDTLFWRMDDGSFDGWPQWNEDKEKDLHCDLTALIHFPAHEAREKLLALEKNHGRRRDLVWVELGEAPLACALKHLTVLADVTKTSLAAGTVNDLATGYSHMGWKADDAVIQALAHIDKITDFEAVSNAIRSVYLPWAEESARHLQKIVAESVYPVGAYVSDLSCSFHEGECVLFVDGLRYDSARRLAAMLEELSYNVGMKTGWAALPSLTATGKPVVSPIGHLIKGALNNTDFEPVVAETGQSLKGGYHFKKLLTDSGWTILESSDNGNGKGKAWCEFGNIDHEGHERGWKLAKHMEALLNEIRDRIAALVQVGWKSVRVVTDHGWLLMPGSLPKTELSSALTENKWGRCAVLKQGATCEERLYPWYWDPNQFFALADGISCFKKGEEYSHGGLSLQECLTCQLTVSSGSCQGTAVSSVTITDLAWKGLRCTVAAEGHSNGLSLDVRTQAGDPRSSVVVGLKPLKDNGTASVVVENEELEGVAAMVILIDEQGGLAVQVATVVGGGKK